MASFPPAFFGFMYGITTIATTPMQFVNIPMYNYIQDNPGEELTIKNFDKLNSHAVERMLIYESRPSKMNFFWCQEF